MNRLTCQRAQRLISDRLDQPLAPDDAAALAAHLRDCAECARFEARLRTQMGQIARLPVAPRQEPGRWAARSSAPGTAWAWVARGAQLAVAVLAVLLVTRLTIGLLGQRAATLGRPAPTEIVVAFASPPATATPPASARAFGAELATHPATPSNSPRLALATPAGTPARATTVPTAPPTATTAPQQISYGQAVTLDQQEALWKQLVSEQGESIAAILRPDYLPQDFQRVQAGYFAAGSGQFAVNFVGESKQPMRISAGLRPEQLYTAALLADATRTTVTVRGQRATLIGPTGPQGTVILIWDEPGRWTTGGGTVADRIPYSLSVQGVSVAEVQRVAASLAPQTTAQLAGEVIRRFYAAINARDYRAGFALFDDSWAQTYEDFAGGFGDTARDDLDILGVRASDQPGHFFVQVRLLATHDDGSRQWYTGTYEIGGTRGAARIVGADIRAITEAEATQLAPK